LYKTADSEIFQSGVQKDLRSAPDPKSSCPRTAECETTLTQFAKRTVECIDSKKRFKLPNVRQPQRSMSKRCIQSWTPQFENTAEGKSNLNAVCQKNLSAVAQPTAECEATLTQF